MVFFEKIIQYNNLRNQVVNILGSSGTGKTSVINDFLSKIILRKEVVVCIALDRSPEKVISFIGKLTELSREEVSMNLIVIDGYNPITGQVSQQKYSFNAGDLSEFGITLSEALRMNPEIVVIDPISTLLIHNTEQEFINSLQIIISKIHKHANYGFLITEEGVHSKRFYNTLRYLSDINLLFKKKQTVNGEVYRALKIHSSRTAYNDDKWHLFSIDKKGKTKLGSKRNSFLVIKDSK